MRLASALISLAALTTPLSVSAEVLYAITVPTGSASNLVSFDSAAPGILLSNTPISGISTQHVLRAIDFRPANGALYAVSTDSTDNEAAQLYTIDLATGVATSVGGGFTLTGNTSTRVSIDFNPVVDRLRVVTGTGQSYRVNAASGDLVAQDTNISGSPLISGIAYSDNVAGATQTTLYAYDFIGDNLGTIGGLNGVPSPNGGTFTVIGSSGITTFNAGLGFDISGASGVGYVSVDDFDSPGFSAEFYSINLATGALTQIGGNDLWTVLDISVQPGAAVPVPSTLALMGFGLAAAAGVSRRSSAQR